MLLIKCYLSSVDFQKQAGNVKISVNISCVEVLCKWDEDVGHTGEKSMYSIT